MRQLTKEEIVTKWGPVIDTLNPKSRADREKLCLYAHQHALIESENDSDGTPVSPLFEPFGKNLLPIALRIMSKVNDLSKVSLTPLPAFLLEKNGKTWQENVKTFTMNVRIDKNDLRDMQLMHGIDLIQETEHILTDEAANQLNDIIEKGSKIHMLLAAASIVVITEGPNDPKISLRSRFFIEREGFTIEDL